MSERYVDSNKVSVYPSGYREVTKDVEASRTTEGSIAKALVAPLGHKNFIKAEGNDAIIVLGGWVFKVKDFVNTMRALFNDIPEITDLDVWAYLNVANIGVQDALGQYLKVVTNSQGGSQVDTSGKFEGICFTDSQPNETLHPYQVKVLSFGVDIPRYSTLHTDVNSIYFHRTSAQGGDIPITDYFAGDTMLLTRLDAMRVEVSDLAGESNSDIELQNNLVAGYNKTIDITGMNTIKAKNTLGSIVISSPSAYVNKIYLGFPSGVDWDNIDWDDNPYFEYMSKTELLCQTLHSNKNYVGFGSEGWLSFGFNLTDNIAEISKIKLCNPQFGDWATSPIIKASGGQGYDTDIHFDMAVMDQSGPVSPAQRWTPFKFGSDGKFVTPIIVLPELKNSGNQMWQINTEYNDIDYDPKLVLKQDGYNVVEIIPEYTSGTPHSSTVDYNVNVNCNVIMPDNTKITGAISRITYQTNKPTSNNTKTGLRVVVLDSKPSTLYDGYLYIITE